MSISMPRCVRSVKPHRALRSRLFSALAALPLLALSAAAQAQLVVTPIGSGGVTPASMADMLLQNAVGITIVDVTYTGAIGASGIFAGGTSSGGIIGFGSGVLLTSGSVNNVVGPNVSASSGFSNGLPGDPQLDALVSGNTRDASILQITFIPVSSQVRFSYTFGSEEYPEFAGGSFNDVFSFFINGINYALIPNTPTPVAINNINCGVSGTGAGPNCNLYINNPVNSNFRNTALDGLTQVLSFTAPVTPGVINTLRLSIADRQDTIYDSAVFIQQGSFGATTSPIQVPPPIIKQALAAPAPATNDFTGKALAVSDDVMVVGVPGRNSSEGVVLVYNRTGTLFSPASSAAASASKQVEAIVEDLGDHLGLGQIPTTGEWEPGAVLRSGNPATKDPRTGKLIGDKFGAATAVSPDGDTIVVGLPGANSGGGKVRVFRRGGATWNGSLTGGTELSPTTSVNVSNPRAFGESVDIDGNGNIVVGAPDSTVNGMAEAGAAYNFFDNGVSIPMVGAPMTAGAPQAGADFGHSVAVDAGLVAVGAPLTDVSETDSGAAYVFIPLDDGGGTGVGAPARVTCSGTGSLGDKAQCGDSVDVDGDTIVVGAPGIDNPAAGETDTGSVEVLRRGTLTSEINPTASLRPGAGSNQAMGSSVAVVDNVVVAGAPEAAVTQPNQGKTFVFGMPEAGFTPGAQVASDLTLASNEAVPGQFGSAVDISARNLAVGVPNATTSAVATAGRGDTFVLDRIDQSNFEGPNENYEIRDSTTASCRYSYIDPSSHTVLPFDFDDDGRAVAAQAVGPTGFNFYGQPVSSLVMSTNGYLSTDLGDEGDTHSNSCVPTSGDDRIMVLHDDLVVETGGSLRRAYFPTCPRAGDIGTNLGCTVFSWVNMFNYSTGTGTAEFQAILYDGSFEIVYQYKTPDSFSGGQATVGIRKSATRQAQYSCNEARAPAGRAVCLFHPRFPPR